MFRLIEGDFVPRRCLNLDLPSRAPLAGIDVRFHVWSGLTIPGPIEEMVQILRIGAVAYRPAGGGRRKMRTER